MRKLPYFLCFSLGIALAAGTAQAAVKVAQVVVLGQSLPASALRNATPQQRARMKGRVFGRKFFYTTYVAGDKTRTDSPDFTWLAESASANILAIDPKGHTYSVTTIDRRKAGLAGLSLDATLTRTGKTQTILGHLCRDYRVASPPGPSDRLTGDLWVAEDLPRTAMPLPEGPLGPFLAKHWKKVRGMPLKAALFLDQRNGRLSLTLQTTSVSKVSAPKSFFAIPSGYKRSDK